MGSAAAAGVGAVGATPLLPMYRGGPALTGVAAGTIADRPTRAWTFKTGGPVKSSPPYRRHDAFGLGLDEAPSDALKLAETGKPA